MVRDQQDATGKWLALDARWLLRQQRSISWVYDSALRVELQQRLAVSWRPLPNGAGQLSVAPVIAPPQARFDPDAVVRQALDAVAQNSATWLRAGGRAAPPASLEDMGYDQDELWADPIVAAYVDRCAIALERDRLTGAGGTGLPVPPRGW